MAQAAAAAEVLVVVLDKVSNVLHPVLPAPVSNLAGEIPTNRLGHRVHINLPDLGGFAAVKVLLPQQRQVPGEIPAQSGPQLHLHLVAPRLVVHLPQPLAALIEMSVSNLRLIGEEACDGSPEVRLIPLPVGFVDCVQQYPAGDPVHHIDVAPVGAPVPGQVQGVYPPRPILRGEGEPSGPHLLRQVQNVFLSDPAQPYRRDTQQEVILEMPEAFHVHGILLVQIWCPVREFTAFLQGNRQTLSCRHLAQHLTDQALPA